MDVHERQVAATEAGPTGGEALQVIGLRVGREQFLVSILKVREIVRFDAAGVTRVPHSHPFVLGVANLRGKVVPVIDLATRLGLPAAAVARCRLVVVESGAHVVGFAVEAVSEVRRLPLAALEELPVPDDLTVGIAKLNGRVAALLDLELAVPASAVRDA